MGGLLVVAHLDPKKRGSIEDQFAAVARRLAGRGVPVTLAFARRPARAVAELLESAGARCEVVDG